MTLANNPQKDLDAGEDLFETPIMHRINRQARIHHDNRAGSPPDLPMRGARDNRDAGDGTVAPVT
jgi:hypothetical protein